MLCQESKVVLFSLDFRGEWPPTKHGEDSALSGICVHLDLCNTVLNTEASGRIITRTRKKTWSPRKKRKQTHFRYHRMQRPLV